MKNKILSILLLCFSVLFLIFPVSYGVKDLKILILFICLVSFCMYILKMSKIKINEKYYLWIILLSAIISRIGIVLIFGSYVTQVSDFASSLKASFDLDFSSDYYRVFTHWIMYPTILHYIYKVFGESQIVALMTNAIILVFASIMVYKTSLLILKNKSYAFIAAIIYILWPANIFYTLIFTQEHLCSLLLLIVFYLFLRLDYYNFKFGIKLREYVIVILIGVLLAFSTFFKNFAPVCILAFIIYLIIKFLQCKNQENKYIFNRVLFIIILLFSFSLSKNVIFMGIDHLVGNKTLRNIIPCYLNVGLRDNGTYDSDNYAMYFDTLREYNYDADKTNEKIMNDLLKYWNHDKNIYSIFELLNFKSEVIFGGDQSRISWINESFKVNRHYGVIKIIDEKVKVLNDCYFIVLVGFMSLGLLKLNKEKNLEIFLSYLFFFGAMLLLLLVEAQNRYMYSIQFFMCILATCGLSWLFDKY